MTESAIPPHLRRQRTCPVRFVGDYTPPYPSYSVRFGTAVRAVVMVYLGVQYRGSEPVAAIARIRDALSSGPVPFFWEPTRFVDATGATNWIAVAYWADPQSFAEWQRQSVWRTWWESAERLAENVGYFMEVLQPGIESFETLATSRTRHEGVLRLCSHVSGEVQEHAYWGSARDRIPAAQTDRLEPSGKVDFEISGSAGRERVRILSHTNVCVIRSGQDWSDATGRERELYLQKMEPVLRRGMEFLRDGNPQDTGCYSCRYADVLDSRGQPLDKRFGLAWFRSLHDLERWSESHPTHLAIFNTFMEMVQELQGQLATQFYHEVSVVKADEQHLEYVNCHPATGLLRLLGEHH
jgi:aldoxime dehydratase